MENNSEKYSISNVIKWILILLGIGIALYLLWYFRFLVLCIFIALVLSIIGQPLMNALGKIKIGKIHLNKSLCSALTLIVEIGIISAVVYLLVPLIISQAQEFSTLDMNKIEQSYSAPMERINGFISKYNLLPDNVNLETYISSQVMGVLNSVKLPQIAQIALSLLGKIGMGILITAFITFFFLKDSHIVAKFIDSVTPDKYLNEVHNILRNSRNLITRYFIGVFCEILLMITLLSIGYSVAGFANAILIACICGIMVILPYIGVIIGGGIGLIILLTATLSANPSADVLTMVITYVCIFAGVKLIDDFLLQPFIYSKSVKAQPLEIFLIILMAGEIGGIVGMILAIPVYTFLRIIAKEFFNKWKFIKTLTKEID
ncbi:MAG: AI-2E family transporter [Bacteroidales bacterium]|nr:AI-2E family transporter [Bacteroidales bacterium]